MNKLNLEIHWKKETLLGPLHSQYAVKVYEDTIIKAKKQGGKIVTGGKKYSHLSGNYVQPTLIECDKNIEIIKEENFCPNNLRY